MDVLNLNSYRDIIVCKKTVLSGDGRQHTSLSLFHVIYDYWYYYYSNLTYYCYYGGLISFFSRLYRIYYIIDIFNYHNNIYLYYKYCIIVINFWVNAALP
jgi:hypothetical protein